MTPEDIKKLDPRIVLAMLNFSLLFSQYIEETDPQLWERGVDYAKSFVSVEGVDIEYR